MKFASSANKPLLLGLLLSLEDCEIGAPPTDSAPPCACAKETERCNNMSNNMSIMYCLGLCSNLLRDSRMEFASVRG